MRMTSSLRLSVLLGITMLTLSACAPAPIYKAAPGTVVVLPAQAAQTPEQFSAMPVVWGGRVVSVQNLADHSELEVLAYPLDGSQRPLLRKPSIGRFIAILPGYVEALNFPTGAPITVSGKLNGSHAGKVGEAAVVFPLVITDATHLWTPGEMAAGKVSFGVGVGVGIR